MNGDFSHKGSTSSREKSKRFRLGRLLLIALIICSVVGFTGLAQVAHAQAQEGPAFFGHARANALYFLPIDLGPAWQARITLTNLEQSKTTVHLSAYDSDGGFFGELSAIDNLAAEETRTIEADEIAPQGSTTLTLETDGNLGGSLLLTALDGEKSEAIPAMREAAQQLDFPFLLDGDYQDKTITLLNVGFASAGRSGCA